MLEYANHIKHRYISKRLSSIDRVISRDVTFSNSSSTLLLRHVFFLLLHVRSNANQSIYPCALSAGGPVKVTGDRYGLTNGVGTNRMDLEERIFAKACLEVEEVPWETLKSNSGSGEELISRRSSKL